MFSYSGKIQNIKKYNIKYLFSELFFTNNIKTLTVNLIIKTQFFKIIVIENIYQ